MQTEMHTRKPQNVSRKTPTFVSTGQANTANSRRRQNGAYTAAQSATIEDAAANDHHIPDIDLDFIHQQVSFFQRVSFIKAINVMRLFIASAIIFILLYLFPGILGTINSGVEQLKNRFISVTKKTTPGPLPTELTTTTVENNFIPDLAADNASFEETEAQQYIQIDEPTENRNRILLENFEENPLTTTSPPNKRRQKSPLQSHQTRKSVISGDQHINSSEIETLLNQYRKNYTDGDTSMLLAMFIESNEQQVALINSLIQYYHVLFAQTKRRRMEFKDLNWVHDNNRSTGSGHIETNYTSHNLARRTVTVANISIELRRSNDEIKIAYFTVTHRKTKHTKLNNYFNADNDKMSISDLISPRLPSESQLKNMVSRFVWAYEGGDIDVLDGLLANNIITSDKNNKAETKKGYLDLFTSSSSRQMLIQDIRWKFTKNHAKGVGRMKSVIVNKNEETSTIEGKIEFVARKINDKVVITHLYHTDHSR